MKFLLQIIILTGLTVVAVTNCRHDKKKSTTEPSSPGQQPPSDWDGSSDWQSSVFKVTDE